MTANDKTADGNIDATTVNHSDLDGAETHVLAERLDTLSNRLALDITQLSDSLENGEEISVEEVEEIRKTLRRVEGSLDTLTEPEEPEEIPLRLRAYGSRREALPLGDLPAESTERLIEAPAEEVSWLLTSDLKEITEITQRVDHNLRSGRLLDHHAGLIWRCSDRLRSWASDVLNERTDDRVIMDKEETRDRLSETQLLDLGIIEAEEETDPEEVVGGAMGYE
jgi:hypothetical protein